MLNKLHHTSQKTPQSETRTECTWAQVNKIFGSFCFTSVKFELTLHIEVLKLYSEHISEKPYLGFPNQEL